MLISDEGDNDLFFDSLDCLSPTQDSLLTKQQHGYEIWVNQPLSVKERRDRFLQGMMGLVDASSNFCSSEEKIMCCDFSSVVELGIEERVRDFSGTVSTEQLPHKLVLSRRESTSEARVSFELSSCNNDKPDGSVNELRHIEAEALEEFQVIDVGKKKRNKWWKHFVNRGKVGSKLKSGRNKTRRVNVRHNKKRWKEFSAMYIGQEIRAHEGLIWTMKFSPNGQYLATGGEDGVVRIWRVSSLNTSSICFAAEDSAFSKVKHDTCSPMRHSSRSPIVLPNKILKIEESPLQVLYGHSSDVMDLAWSNSDILLSSSMDKTVRMWKIGCDQCLRVFRHSNYVTCIQFNPIDENYFISGSIDGKVRIWGVHEERVVDWADIRDVVSAVSYQPDGKGFVVGSLSGTCRFYVASGKHFELEAQICVNGKKRTYGNKITGIQFSQKNHQRVMITSEDSKVRILEGVEFVQTYKGLPKSGSQMSGSFTSSGKHIVSVGRDSRVYIWNFNDSGNASSKQKKSENSCEYFSSEGVTVAIPWSGMSAERSCSRDDVANYSSEKQRQLETSPCCRESERFSFGSWFSIDGSCRGSMTWPEEKLPSWDLPLAEIEFDHEELCLKDPRYGNCVPETWGQSIVTAGCDGTIKTVHNFGFPVRL